MGYSNPYKQNLRLKVEAYVDQNDHLQRERETKRIQALIDKLHIIDTIVTARWMLMKIKADKEQARADVIAEIRNARRRHGWNG